MDCGDLLTCGECHLVFALSDILSFIRHKQSTCRSAVLQAQQDHISDHDDDDEDNDDDDDVADANGVNGTAPAADVVGCGIAGDDKTNGSNFDSHVDEHPSHLGLTLLYKIYRMLSLVMKANLWQVF